MMTTTIQDDNEISVGKKCKQHTFSSSQPIQAIMATVEVVGE